MIQIGQISGLRSALNRLQQQAVGFGRNRVVFIGDSITLGSGDRTNPDQPIHGVSFAPLACGLSQGRLLMVRNQGIAGQTSAEVLARFDTDVVAYAPGIVHILAGTNDVESVSGSVTLANILAMVKRAKATGSLPIVGTLPPKDTATTIGQRNIQYVNTRLRYLASQHAFLLVDYFTALADPATADGHFVAAYTADGVHTTRAGQVVMATALANAVANLLSPNVPTCKVTTTADRFTTLDSTNIVRNGAFLTDENVDSVPEFWTGGADANHVYTMPADANISGAWVQVVKSNSTLRTLLSQTVVTDLITDLVVDASLNTKVTSALNPLVSSDVGMILAVTGGEGFNIGEYLGIFLASAALTCDQPVGLVGSTGGQARLGIGGGWDIGDTVALCCRVQTEDVVAGGLTYQIRLNFVGATKFLTIANSFNYDTNPAGGLVLYGEAVVPVGTTSITCEMFLNSGTGTIRVAEVAFRNLTKLEAV